MSPAQHAELAVIAAEHAAAGHGEKGAIVKAAAAKMGVDESTLFRWLADHRYAPRKRRSDAGKSAISRDELLFIAAAVTETIRNNGKVGMTLENAIRSARADGKIRADRVDTETGEITPLSVSAIARALRNHHLDPASLKRPAPHVRLKSRHPNYCWEADASVCVLYYLPATKRRDASHALMRIKKEKHYKNKPENLQAIEKFRVIRYVLTDHYSGVIRVRYYPHSESGAHTVAMLAHAMAKKASPADPFHGRPKFLMIDPGATAANLVRLFCDQLGIQLIVNKAHNPRAKGQVEEANNFWERHFESRLAFVQHEIQSFDDLNRLSEKMLIALNAHREHSRHGMTRFQKWLEITDEELVTTVSEAKLLELAHGTPVAATVNGDLKVRFDRRIWDVRHVPDVVIGMKLSVCPSPFIEGGAVALVKGADGRFIQYPLEAEQKDKGGFMESAALIGEEMKGVPDTVVEKNKKEILLLATGEKTLQEAEAARKAKTFAPFRGEFHPYRDEENAPKVTWIPRAGTPMDAPVIETAERTLDAVDACFTVREALGADWTPEMFEWFSKRYAGGIGASALRRWRS
jgi:transposase-like protein